MKEKKIIKKKTVKQKAQENIKKNKTRAANKEIFPLTDKEEIFCYEYIKDLNANASARRAGYAMTPGKCHAALLRKKSVAKLIKRLLAERKKSCSIEALQVLEEIVSIAKADVNSFLEVKGNDITLRDLNKVDTRSIASIKATQYGINFKLNDKIKALDMLGKHFGLWVDTDKAGELEDFGKLLVDAMNKRQKLEEEKSIASKKDTKTKDVGNTDNK